MIVKDITFDERVWGLSDQARGLFPFTFPYIENDGTIPRRTKVIRLTCFPLAEITDQEAESVILEWIAAKLCAEKKQANGLRLFFVDFEKSNSSLDMFRMRRTRSKDHMPTNGHRRVALS